MNSHIITHESPKLKIAIVHNWFWKMRGAEKCLEQLCQLYPDADIYALFGNLENISSAITSHKITFSWLQKIPFIKYLFRYTLLLWPLAIESFDLQDYDVVISISAAVSKGVLTNVNTTHISYINTPMRYIWSQKDVYTKRTPIIKQILMSPFLAYLRMWDVTAAERVDINVPISKFIARSIKKYYGITADKVIYPPVDLDSCYATEKRGNYYLSLSPFEENKGIKEIVVLAKETGIRVKITGTGPLLRSMKRIARGYENIEFLGWVSDEDKYKLLSEAKGYFIFGIEDFGITSVEAIASGCPVLAYDKGGASEIVIDKVSGLLFNNIDSKSILASFRKFEKMRFSSEKMQASVKKFSEEEFRNKFKELVKDVH